MRTALTIKICGMRIVIMHYSCANVQSTNLWQIQATYVIKLSNVVVVVLTSRLKTAGRNAFPQLLSVI
jgi:hypothetical protein